MSMRLNANQSLWEENSRKKEICLYKGSIFNFEVRDSLLNHHLEVCQAGFRMEK